MADVTMSAFSFPARIEANIFVSWLPPFKEQRLVECEEQMDVLSDAEPADTRRATPLPDGADAAKPGGTGGG